MRTYKMQKGAGTDSKHPDVREKRMEWNLPAMIISVLLAVAIWLYMVSFMPPLESELPIDTTPTVEENTPSESADANEKTVGVGTPAREEGGV